MRKSTKRFYLNNCEGAYNTQEKQREQLLWRIEMAEEYSGEDEGLGKSLLFP